MNMLLCVDIGNTDTACGVFENTTFIKGWKLSSNIHRTSDEYGILFDSIIRMNGISPQAIHGVCIVSVVAPLIDIFVELSHRFWHVDPLVVDAGIRTGVRIRTENPRDVGPDRIANAVAAFKEYGGPACIVDFSTVTIFDAISDRGDYLGGAIGPGIESSLKLVSMNTTRLPQVGFTRPGYAIGKNTVESIQSGFYFGYIGLVEKLIQQFRCELGETMLVIATGGQSDKIAKEIKTINNIDPWLSVKGLRHIYFMNNE